MSVGFTDEDKDTMLQRGYTAGKSELGYVYYPAAGVSIPGNITVKYMEYPWISCFEVEGIEIPKKEGDDDFMDWEDPERNTELYE